MSDQSGGSNAVAVEPCQQPPLQDGQGKLLGSSQAVIHNMPHVGEGLSDARESFAAVTKIIRFKCEEECIKSYSRKRYSRKLY